MTNIPSQIEDALLTRLAELAATMPDGYVRTLRSYAGDYNAARKEITLLLPCILVCYAGAEYRALGGAAYEVSSEWRIVVADNNHRGEIARRRGADPISQNPGTYQMLQDVKALLDAAILLPGTKGFELFREDLVERQRNLSLYTQLWRTRYIEFTD
jgi:phage gp37-like protein